MSCAGSQHLLAASCSVVVRASSLFVSPRFPSRPFSKNEVSYFLREVISEAGAVRADVAAPLRALSVRGVAPSISFLRNWSISKVLEAATWRSNSVFASFYFCDISFVFQDCSLFARLSWRAVLLTPRNVFWGAYFNSGDLFWVMGFNPAELGLTFESPGDCMSG